MTDHSLWGRNVWFLDFEGNKAGEIFLAGTLHSGEFRQVILDHRLSGLALQHSMELKTPFEFIDDLMVCVRRTGITRRGEEGARFRFQLSQERQVGADEHGAQDSAQSALYGRVRVEQPSIQG